MAEEKNGKIVSAGKGNTTCACGPGCVCGCGHYCMHRILWWIVGIIVIIVVFCIGVKAGEFREELRSMFGGYNRGYPVMQYHSGYGVGAGGGGVAVPVTGNAAGSATSSSGTAPVGL